MHAIRLSALIAKIEDAAIRGASALAAKTSELAFEVKAQRAARKMINAIQTPEEIREQALIARRVDEILIERLRTSIIEEVNSARKEG